MADDFASHKPITVVTLDGRPPPRGFGFGGRRIAPRAMRCQNCTAWDEEAGETKLRDHARAQDVVFARGMTLRAPDQRDGLRQAYRDWRRDFVATVQNGPHGVCRADKAHGLDGAPALVPWTHACDAWTARVRPDGATELPEEANARLVPSAPIPEGAITGLQPVEPGPPRETMHYMPNYTPSSPATACGAAVIADEGNATDNPDDVYGCEDCIVAAARARRYVDAHRAANNGGGVP